MKLRIQPSKELIAALLCAAAWYAVWFAAARPAAVSSAAPVSVPAASYLPAGGEEVRAVLSPVLFAFPSQQGFSRGVPEERIDLRLALEKPQRPARFLPRPEAPPPAVHAAALMDGLPPSVFRLPVPAAAAPVRPLRAAEPVQLFLSPELAARAAAAPRLDLNSTNSSGQVRVHLSVRTDGTVSRVFFDTPRDDPSLLRALFRLRFAPAEKETESWLDIRFAPANGGAA